MKIFTRITVLLYVTLMLYIGVFAVLFSLDLLNVSKIITCIYLINTTYNLKILLGFLGGLLLLFNYIFYSLFSVNIHRDKIIAFDNPSGRVSVSLLALQELIKRIVIKLPEIKDIKTDIVASRKGIKAKVKLSLKSDTNIPEITSKIQDLIKSKIQRTIGVEDPIDISIYVRKIFLEKIKIKDKKSTENKEIQEEKEEPNIPFRGYRA